MLPYKKLDPSVPDLARGTTHSAGIDLINSGERVVLGPGDERIVPTGCAVAIPIGALGLVTVRSKFGFGYGLASHIGVIDADYRGEIKVKLFNHSRESVAIEPFERVAQLTIIPFLALAPKEVSELDETERGASGFGSTGK